MKEYKLTISIVMPLYNKEAEVERAVRSVLKQTISDFELIIVNDGSVDGGPERVRAFSDPRIRIIDQTNAGVSAARNRGIGEARADLIAFLDADDEWEKDYLETIVRLRDKFPSCEVFASSYFVSTADGKKRRAIIRGLPEKLSESILNNYFFVAAQSDPPLWTSAVAVAKHAIKSVGGFPVGITAGEDLLTWARLAVRFDIAYSLEPKAIFREPATVSSRPGRVPQTPDIVGQELRKLLAGVARQKKQGLNRYIGLWHRMRANIFLRLGRRWEVLREVARSLRHAPLDIRLPLYAMLAVLPLSPSIMMAIRELVRKRNEMV